MNKPQRMIYQTDETRNRILEQATLHFSQHGFFDAQMKDIAAAVGMSRNTLYRYYQNKMDLGFAILEAIFQRHGKTLKEKLSDRMTSQSSTGLEQLAYGLRCAALDMGNSDEMRFIAEFDGYFSNSRAPEDFRQRIIAMMEVNIIGLLNTLHERGQADGSVRCDQDSRLVLVTAFESLYALRLRLALRGKLLVSIKPEDESRLVDQLLELLVQGMATELRS